MKKINIAFVIPTFNRLEKLRVALSHIERQVVDDRFSVNVVISNSASTDGTYEFIDRLAKSSGNVFVSNLTDGADIIHNFRRAVDAIPNHIDWVWFHGDDDHVIYERACQEIVELLVREENSGVEFIHVAQARRSSSVSTPLSGTLFELCNQVGFHEILGWMSSLFVRRDKFVNAMSSAFVPGTDLSKLSAYKHSTAIFEQCGSAPAILIDQPWVEPQDLNQSAESIERWSKENVGERYFYLLDDWRILADKGMLAGGVSTVFFRYLNYSLLDRLSVQVAGAVLSGAPVDDRLVAHWNRLERVADLLADAEEKKRLTQWLNAFGALITGFEGARATHIRSKAALERQVSMTNNTHQYPFSLLPRSLD
jgi:hypothetical protein